MAPRSRKAANELQRRKLRTEQALSYREEGASTPRAVIPIDSLKITLAKLYPSRTRGMEIHVFPDRAEVRRADYLAPEITFWNRVDSTVFGQVMRFVPLISAATAVPVVWKFFDKDGRKLRGKRLAAARWVVGLMA